MKKLLLVGLMVVTLSLLVGLAVPAFAHGPGDGEPAPADQDTWEAMHEACEEGDWEKMDEAAEEFHGEDSGYMPYHGDDTPQEENGGSSNYRGSMGGHMGSGQGGMMNW